MNIEGIDPRDTEWEVDAPAYRVYFFADSGRYTDEYQLTDVDADEVLAWAMKQADGREFIMYVVHNEAGSIGLIRLSGTDPNAP